MGLVADLQAMLARRSHLDFIKYTWQRPDPFIEAKATPFQVEMCNEIDKAMVNYAKGISTYLMILICFGHGKSDISSRYLPAHFLGENPDAEVIVTSHNDTMAQDFSRFGRKLIQSDEYRGLYPNVRLSHDSAGVESWGIQGHQGKAQFFGLGSGSSGKRGSLIVVDDFFGKREDAESQVIRDRAWERLTDDIISRRAPASIVLWVVTPWNMDDPVGRVIRRMKEDETFPRFKIIQYPAKSAKYPSGYLFPERYNPAWYEDQFKLLGSYSAASRMQCEPINRHGGQLKTEDVKIAGHDLFYQMCGRLPVAWGWDLASSQEERNKDNPDYTVGYKVRVDYVRTAVQGVDVPVLYIEHRIKGQYEAKMRNDIIVQASVRDPEGGVVGVEAFGGYKDAYTQVRDILKGIRQVRKVNLPGDKVSKAGLIEPLFEAGNVIMLEADWNDDALEQLGGFPNLPHDDDPDALVVAFATARKRTGSGDIMGV